MAWIATVAPYDTATSLWANSIRDSVVTSYASIAARDANNAAAKEGMVAWADAENTLAIRSAGVWIIVAQPWQSYTPQVVIGATTAPSVTFHRAQYQRTFDTMSVRFDLDIIEPSTSGGMIQIFAPIAAAGAASRDLVTGQAKTVDYALGGKWYGPAILGGTGLYLIIPHNGALGPVSAPAGASGGLINVSGSVDYPIAPGHGMSTFGDVDPEDAYDAGDSADLRLRVLLNVVAHLRDHPDAARLLLALRILDALDADLDALRCELEGM